MNLKNTNILVTGGAGFIGSHIVDRLIRKETGRIIILDNLECGHKSNLKEALKNPKVKFVKGDIRDKNKLNKLAKNIDVIFHEAALRHTQCSVNPREGHEVLVDGTFNVFDGAVKNKVKKVVFASSASVYGDPKSLPMYETDIFNDKTFYGAGKIYNEKLASAFKEVYGLSSIGLRNFNVYGPRMDILGIYTQVLIRWLEKIRQGVAPVVYGDGKQSLDFIYVDDVVDANILAAESKEEGIFNVGSGKETTLLELLKMLLKVTNSNLEPVFQPAPSHSLANRRKASTKLADKVLNFRAKTSLAKGLENLVKWYDEQKK